MKQALKQAQEDNVETIDFIQDFIKLCIHIRV
jgi:hypothetical protein